MDIDSIPLEKFLEREDVKRVLRSAYDRGASDERKRLAGEPSKTQLKREQRRQRHEAKKRTE